MPVDEKNLMECIKWARLFMERADVCLKDLRSNEQPYADTRLTAAVRRTSMDLTRALSKLRKH
jgi:hypothetical protein